MPTTLSEPKMDVPINLAVSKETDEGIARLARSLGVSKEGVFSRALALLSLAIDAKQEGNQIAIVDQSGHVVTEISGI